MLVVVGRIGRPHGIRGEVTVEVRTDEPDIRFADGATLATDTGQLTIAGTHWHSGRLLVSFAGVEDRTAAERLRGLLLRAERSEDASPDDPEEYYDSTLIGCAVVQLAGTTVGVISDVLHLPGQDLLSVDTGEGEVLVPFVRRIVPEVDIPGRTVRIDPPPGLLGDGES